MTHADLDQAKFISGDVPSRFDMSPCRCFRLFGLARPYRIHDLIHLGDRRLAAILRKNVHRTKLIDTDIQQITEAGEAIVLGASTPGGRLRVSAPVVFAHVALPRIGARFAFAYPEVKLEIVAEDRKVDPVEDGYDLVIRIDPSPDERFIGRRFLNDERLIVATPDMPRPQPAPGGGPSAVKAVLLSATSLDVVWCMKSDFENEVLFKPDPILRFSSLLMVRDAVLAGAGAALLAKLLVAGDIEAGRLVCWGTHAGPSVEIWALQSSRRLIGAKVRALGCDGEGVSYESFRSGILRRTCLAARQRWRKRRHRTFKCTGASVLHQSPRGAFDVSGPVPGPLRGFIAGSGVSRFKVKTVSGHGHIGVAYSPCVREGSKQAG